MAEVTTKLPPPPEAESRWLVPAPPTSRLSTVPPVTVKVPVTTAPRPPALPGVVAFPPWAPLAVMMRVVAQAGTV